MVLVCSRIRASVSQIASPMRGMTFLPKTLVADQVNDEETNLSLTS